MILFGLLIGSLAAGPATDRPVVSYGSLASFVALDCIEDWMQLCSPPAGPWRDFQVFEDRVEVWQMEPELVFRIAARSPESIELTFDRCVPALPKCDGAGRGAKARLELHPGGRAAWVGPRVERIIDGHSGASRDRVRVELIDNAQYTFWIRELERRYVPGGKCEGLGGYEPVGGRPCINAPGGASLRPAQREERAAHEAGSPCSAVSAIRVMPFRAGETGTDRAYDGLISAGCAVVPCLIDRIADTKRMPDPRQAPIFAGFTVGDAALFMASEITGRSFEESLPTKVRARIPDEGVYAYFRLVATRANREAIRADWRRWLAAHPECR